MPHQAHPAEFLTDEELAAHVHSLVTSMDNSARRWACDLDDCDGLPHEGWLHNHARAKQQPPRWLWTTWMLMMGRGSGKSRSAAELVREWASVPGQQIAVVAKKEGLVRSGCFEHRRSGLLAVIPPHEVATYRASPGSISLTLKNGSVIRGFGAEVPDNLRSWEFDKAWCDEFASWSRGTAQETLDVLWFCLREASAPQVVISTTPKPLPHVKKLVDASADELRRVAEAAQEGDLAAGDGPRVVITRGHMNENRANLSDAALEELEGAYAGTRLGKQELAGELLEDVEGALWQRWMFEVDHFRLKFPDLPELERVVVAVDPATTTTDTADDSGFAVCARGHWGSPIDVNPAPRGYVLHSEAVKLTPMQTMTRAAELYHRWNADAVILEANNGGDYLATVLQMVDPTVPFRVVNATRGKRARATPVAGLYEQGRVSHVGTVKQYDQLETVMTTYVGAAESHEKSPDILDALVWAMTDLFLDPETALRATGGATSRTGRVRGTGRAHGPR